jgi:hypothetical protein
MTEIQRLGDVLLQALEESKPLLEIIAISGGIIGTRRDRRGYFTRARRLDLSCSALCRPLQILIPQLMIDWTNASDPIGWFEHSYASIESFKYPEKC